MSPFIRDIELIPHKNDFHMTSLYTKYVEICTWYIRQVKKMSFELVRPKKENCYIGVTG